VGVKDLEVIRRISFSRIGLISRSDRVANWFCALCLSRPSSHSPGIQEIIILAYKQIFMAWLDDVSSSRSFCH
jgi:hypothetical protein